MPSESLGTLRTIALGVGAFAVVAAFPFACTRRSTPSPGPEATPRGERPEQTVGKQTVPAGRQQIVETAERALPAVVSVASTRVAKLQSPGLPFDDPFFRRFFGPEGPQSLPMPPGEAPVQQGLGSGVIVGKGVIVTNAHVVEGASRLEVTAQDGRVLEAELAGADPQSDLAVLRITSDTSGLETLEFADSNAVRLGEIVLAIGNPFGVGQTVTMGIVSGKGRANLGIVEYEDFIQTDAAINPGNSGGALVNLEGKLIGIPTAILSRTGGYMGVGFAIPSNMARPIMQALLQEGRVSRGFLGVTIQDVDRDLAQALGLEQATGVLISGVSSGGPAAKYGLRRGDVVVRVAGQEVRNTGQLRNLIAAAGAGKTVDVEIVRNGKRQTLKVQLGEAPRDPRSAEAAPGLDARPGDVAGIAVVPLDPTLRKRLNVPDEVRQGVVVARVLSGSSAARAGIRPGDVLLELDKKPISSPEALRKIWEQAEGKTPVVVFREGRTFFTVLERK
ncbi:MAG TPA: Do family serine endopeptidase [Polyangiaceae bacterium]|nr:Do family serine endopeptidase [Polyangiaceae bacterium]